MVPEGLIREEDCFAPQVFYLEGHKHWDQPNGVVPIGHFARWTKIQMWRQQGCHANPIAVQVTGKCKRIPVSPATFLGPSTTFRWKLLLSFWRMSRSMTQVYTAMPSNQPWFSYGMILFSWSCPSTTNSIGEMFLFCQGVPLDVIYEMFKFAYCMFWLEVEPADSGHGGVSRPRIYIFLSHLETGTVLHDPCVLYCTATWWVEKNGFPTTPQDYWLATDRRDSTWKHGTCGQTKNSLSNGSLALPRRFSCKLWIPKLYNPHTWHTYTLSHTWTKIHNYKYRHNQVHSYLHRPMSHSKDQKDLTYLLTSREKQAVVLLSDHYMTKYGQDPTDAADLCFYLGDNPTYAVTWSAESMKVPCFRNSNGLYWIPSKKRWVTLREKLACLGLPRGPSVQSSYGGPTPSVPGCSQSS